MFLYLYHLIIFIFILISLFFFPFSFFPFSLFFSSFSLSFSLFRNLELPTPLTPQLLQKTKQELETAQEKLRDMSTRVNKKSFGIAEHTEKKYEDLKEKKEIVEKDKMKISSVIQELDQKKVEALVGTWKKVNEFDFFFLLFSLYFFLY